MLQVDIRELRQGPVTTAGALPPQDPVFKGLDVQLDGPVAVDGVLERAGHGGFRWHGQLAGRVRSTCRRCLAEFDHPLQAGVDILFSADPELQEDPSVYPLTEPVSHVDLRQAVREELALAVDAYPLCRDDCRGLCTQCGADLNRGPCGCAAPAA